MQPNSAFLFSTDQVPERDRLAVWREVVGRQFIQLEIEPSEAVPLRAEIRVHSLPSNLVTFIRSTPAKYIRTGAHALSGDGDFTLLRAPRLGFHFASAGQHETFAAGDAMLLANDRVGTMDGSDVPADVSRDGAMNVRINGAQLRAAVRHFDERVAHRVRADSAPLRLVLAYVNSVLHNGPLDPASGHLVHSHIVDLVALALRPAAETVDRARGGAVAAARFAAIRDDILANFAQVRLSAKTVAARHGVSARYVYLLFEQNGLSFNRLVVETRLKRAMTMLLDPTCGHMRMSEIALAAGFGDQTTFNRAFRRYYGDTPLAVRNARG